jgi:protein-S-isoprenylcysteine O-methyltransferase Ste14
VNLSNGRRGVFCQIFKQREFLGKAGIILAFVPLFVLKFQHVITSGGQYLQNRDSVGLLTFLSTASAAAFIGVLVLLTIFRHKSTRSAEGVEPRVTAIAGTFGLMFLAVLKPTQSLPVAVQIIGLGLVVLGIVLSIYVVLWLGRSFSIVPGARKLVTTGPYAVVRHPLYVAEEISAIGVLLLNFSVPAVLLVAGQWLLQLRRMHNEEKVLTAHFPEYADYVKRTPRLIPRPSALSGKGLFSRNGLRP